MPDPFFTSSKTRKRKRTTDVGPSNSKKQSRQNDRQNGTNKQVNGAKKKRDEELDSDNTDGDEGNIDDMDLRAPSDDEVVDDDEDPDETPAEKRLRLAQLYLDSVKDGLKLGVYRSPPISLSDSSRHSGR